MSHNKKLSFTYRILHFCGMNYSEQEYGQISISNIVNKAWLNFYRVFLLKLMNCSIFEPINPYFLRPKLLRMIGCHVGKGVFIGYNVVVDVRNPELITIGDHTHITDNTILLCHKRNLSAYHIGDDYSKTPYKTGAITIGKGCSTGTGTLILPGVTIGDGAIIGAGSLVTKDIPAWTIATGRPAKVVKEIQESHITKEAK